MAIVVYECDRCKRTIQIPQNTQGLEVMGKCIITESCHGDLQFQRVLQTYKTGQPTPIEPGLEDWVQRKALFTFQQRLKNTIWNIDHGMGINPSVKVYVFDTEGNPHPKDPISIVYVDQNNLTITFNDEELGIAQCIARSTAPLGGNIATTTPVAPPVQISTNGFLTIATPDLVNPATMVLQFLMGTTFTPLTTVGLPFSLLPSISTPWGDTDTISINGLVYKVQTVDMAVILSTLSLPDNTPFYVVSVNTTGPISLNDVVILLGKTPFSLADKDLLQIILASSISTLQSAVISYTFQGDLFVQRSLITQMFPPIQFTQL